MNFLVFKWRYQLKLINLTEFLCYTYTMSIYLFIKTIYLPLIDLVDFKLFDNKFG